MNLLYMPNAKMAMVNFHFRQLFREFNYFYEFGQIYMSISMRFGNNTSEPKNL